MDGSLPIYLKSSRLSCVRSWQLILTPKRLIRSLYSRAAVITFRSPAIRGGNSKLSNFQDFWSIPAGGTMLVEAEVEGRALWPSSGHQRRRRLCGPLYLQ